MSSVIKWRPYVWALLGITLVLGACSDPDAVESEPTEAPTSSVTATEEPPTEITFGVYGPKPEVAAYRTITETFTASEGDTVKMVTAPDHDSAMRQIRAGEVPDVFLATQRDVRWLREQEMIQPVDELLDARGVEFGDGFARDALSALSTDNSLQCMPYDISPMVIYVNTQYVDFDLMRERELPTPEEELTGWSFEEFQAAADFATRSGPGIKNQVQSGFGFVPTLEFLAPFFFSAGGELLDDTENPTSTNFSSDDSREALRTLLPFLRDANLALKVPVEEPEQAIRAFKQGRVAMAAGYRNSVPELRKKKGLDFIAMPMPTVGSRATVATVTSLCMSSETAHREVAADFITHSVRSPAVARVAESGYLVPTNLEVAASDSFLQPDRRPGNAHAFLESQRAIVDEPSFGKVDGVQGIVEQGLKNLLKPLPIRLERITQNMDKASRAVLAPEESQSPSESGSSDSSD